MAGKTVLTNCPDCRGLTTITAKRHCPEEKRHCTWSTCSCGATFDRHTGHFFNLEKKK